MIQSASLTVRSGDTLGALAERHGVDAEALMRANGMDPALADGRVSRERTDPDRLMPGQHLQIPSATPGYEAAHVVRRGDTLSAIAERWNVSVPDLLAANPRFSGARIGDGLDMRRDAAGGWDPDALRVGDLIRHPGALTGTESVTATPAVEPATELAPVATGDRAAATGAGRIDLQAFLDPRLGSQAPAAIVIGNAEGTRTAQGGTTAAFGGHIDPGNAAHNQGSFSYQSRAASPAEADRLQLQRLQGRVPAYEQAARAAGLDPSDARLASSYFDLYNQSPAAAARFLDQMPRLSGAALTPERLTQARVDAFVNPDTGRRFTNANGALAGGGFATIAQARLGRNPTEAEVQQTIRADQQRRTDAMENALSAQGLLR
ncbi:MAG TPA: LysM peptidoglycan-binding domain-containing protein [Ideonella sp.]|nr:LysM peptidoglycan-binding domain-containing protein [Ideonella sp.]